MTNTVTDRLVSLQPRIQRRIEKAKHWVPLQVRSLTINDFGSVVKNAKPVNVARERSFVLDLEHCYQVTEMDGTKTG